MPRLMQGLTRRRLRLLLGAGAVLALPTLLAVLLYGLGNSQTGRSWIERATAYFTHGGVQLTGLGGHFPEHLQLQRLELRDDQGLWLQIDDVQLAWSPLKLLYRHVQVSSLQAARVSMARVPSYHSEPKSSATVHRWPHIRVDRLEIARLELAAALTGDAVALQVQGSGSWASLSHASLQLVARRLDAVPSTYRASAQFDSRALQGELAVAEDANGPLAHLIALPTVGALALHLQLAGPREAVVATLSAQAGALNAHADGTLNARTGIASLAVKLDAGAMNPRPGLSWQRLHLTGQWRGALTAPITTAQLEAEGLSVPGVQAAELRAQLQGEAGALSLQASVGGLAFPSRFGALLASAPVLAQVQMRLDQPGRPADFTLSHPRLTASGHWSGGAADGTGTLTASVPDLQPAAGLAALDLDGSGTLEAKLHSQAGQWHLDLASTMDIRNARSPLAALLMPQLRLSAAMDFGVHGFELERSQLQSTRLQAAVHGGVTDGLLNLAWKLDMPDVSALSSRLAGSASAEGQVQGSAPRIGVTADVTAQVAVNGSKSGGLNLQLRARDLPQRPTGELHGAGMLDESPLALEVTAAGTGDGPVRVRVERGEWKSLLARGEILLPGGGAPPHGQLQLAMTHLEDLDRLLGQNLQGAVSARVDFDGSAPGGTARVQVSATDAGLPAQQLKTLQLSGAVNALDTQPTLDLQLSTQALVAGIPTSLQARLSGPLDAVVLEVRASSEGDQDVRAQLSTTATLSVQRRQLQVSALELDYRDLKAHLLAPALLSFGDGIAVDVLRLGLGQSVWQLQGRLTPTLDLSASVRNSTFELTRSWFPTLLADGQVDAEIELHGTLAAPTGSVSVHGHGVRARSGSARGLPTGDITALAQLQGDVAHVEVQISAGERLKLQASGQVPLNRAAAIDLKVNGALDLILVSPILEASGQRLLGEAKLDAQIGGTLSAPQAHGTLQLTKADLQDYPRGVHLSDISATLDADGDQVRLTQLIAHAGPGSISVSGTLGLGSGLPLNLKFEAHNAQPLSSDLITANVDMNLTLAGQLRQKLAAAGTLHINRAELNIPNALPVSVAVLDVRRPGQQVAPPHVSSVEIDLDFAVDAPRAIFISGRGVNAEVGGSLHVAGTSDDPIISGGFDLRTGTINLAGSTLTFSSGRLSFNGTGVKKKIDPTLDFTATTTTGGATSTLNVGGYADAPVITLSSSPEQPQDQILSQLLFGVNPAQLTTLQIAQIAAALATMSGVGGNGFNPLNAVQRKLRLDRLAISSATTGVAPTAAGNATAQGTSTGATIEAGRYVSSRVYVGAKQFTTGTTQAQVQIDLTKSLKVQTAVGTGGGTVQGETPQNDPGSSIGLSYQFEY